MHRHFLSTFLRVCLCLNLITWWTDHHANAGSYVVAGESYGIDIITHPIGYAGSGGHLTITVGINPASAHAIEMEIPLQNALCTLNDLRATTDNLVFGLTNDIPPAEFDFESTILQELGHSMGLGLPNIANESGISGDDTNYTKSTDGADNIFNLNTGSDGVRGSTDDARGDDVNPHWFQKSNSDPFSLTITIDTTTYGRNNTDLPPEHVYVPNADRTVSPLFGPSNTEAMIQQGTTNEEAQRTLNYDDVATLRLAMAGLDETAGTSDDYTYSLEYVGLTTSADIVIDFDSSQTSFATSSVSATFLSDTHIGINSSRIYLNDTYPWFFTQADSCREPFLLTVEKDGGGSGTVTSFSPGINCGSDCQETYFSPTSVTLRAEADSGSVFYGWTGDGCRGTLPCNLLADEDMTVTAIFDVTSRLDCGSAIPLTDEVSYNGSTTNGPSAVSSYSCCIAWLETGPERVHSIATASQGDISATISNLSVDLDVFALDVCNQNSCIACGDNSLNYVDAPPGFYFIVVDGYYGAAGDYQLTVDFVPYLYTISGYVRDIDETGIPGVTLQGLPNTPTTIETGYYECSGMITHGWSGTVTPQASGYVFNPVSISYTAITSHRPDQNYTGLVIPGEAAATTETALTWLASNQLGWGATTEAEGYRIYRGAQSQLQNLPAGASVCLAWEGTELETGTILSAVPPTNELFWYLVTAYNVNGEGEAGGGTGTSRVITSTGACGTPKMER